MANSYLLIAIISVYFYGIVFVIWPMTFLKACFDAMCRKGLQDRVCIPRVKPCCWTNRC